MSIIEAIVLGLVQGLTEFLPVSSSGHLVLMQKVFGIEEGQLFFAVMLHVATLASVVIVLRQEIWQMLKNPFGKKTWMLVIATIPAVIIALLLKDFFEETFSGNILGYMFLLTAVILVLSEQLSKRYGKKAHKEIKLPNAVSMGLMQAVAIIPGVSRSGSTIAGGLFSGVNRSEAASFSFLMSIPVILGSAIIEGMDTIKSGLSNIDFLPVIIGMIFAGVSGYIAVKFMLVLIKKKRLYGFAVYVGILGMLIILDQLFFHVFF